MMDFEEFKSSVVDRIKDFLPEKYADADVSIQTVVKNNDRKLDGLMIRLDDTNIAPNIYLNDLFGQYEQGRGMEDILQNIADVRTSHEASQDFDIGRLTDLEQVKDRIECRLVNLENNAKYLENKPHTQMEDLAVVYAINLGDGLGGHMSAPITSQLLDSYGISKEELHQIAVENIENQHPEFMSMRDMMVQMMFPEGTPDDPMLKMMMPPEEEIPSMYVLTNESRINGAAAVLDTKTMDEIAEKLGGDFIVIPSSIHEVLILPANEDLDRQTLEAMVQDVNAGQVAPEERLSDHVYQYDSKEHELVRMDKMEERQNQREAERQGELREGVKSGARIERKPERDRVSMKDKLPEKKAEVAKGETGREKSTPTKTRDAATLA